MERDILLYSQAILTLFIISIYHVVAKNFAVRSWHSCLFLPVRLQCHYLNSGWYRKYPPFKTL